MIFYDKFDLWFRKRYRGKYATGAVHLSLCFSVFLVIFVLIIEHLLFPFVASMYGDFSEEPVYIFLNRVEKEGLDLDLPSLNSSFKLRYMIYDTCDYRTLIREYLPLEYIDLIEDKSDGSLIILDKDFEYDYYWSISIFTQGERKKDLELFIRSDSVDYEVKDRSSGVEDIQLGDLPGIWESKVQVDFSVIGHDHPTPLLTLVPSEGEGDIEITCVDSDKCHVIKSIKEKLRVDPTATNLLVTYQEEEGGNMRQTLLTLPPFMHNEFNQYIVNFESRMFDNLKDVTVGKIYAQGFNCLSNAWVRI